MPMHHERKSSRPVDAPIGRGCERPKAPSQTLCLWSRGCGPSSSHFAGHQVIERSWEKSRVRSSRSCHLRLPFLQLASASKKRLRNWRTLMLLNNLQLATAQKPVPAAAAQSSTSEASSLEHAPQPTSAADLAAAEDRCFDPDVSGCKLPVGTVPARHEHTIEPLSLEIARGECLRRLRLSFADAIRKLQLTGNVVGAFERWHFGWLLAATSEASVSARSRKDPLLPVATASPEADEALISELKDAGASHAVALGAVSALRTSADMEANNFAAARLGVLKSDPEEIEIELPSTSESGNGSGGLSHINLGSLLPAPLKISNEWLAKLRAMHAAAASALRVRPQAR